MLQTKETKRDSGRFMEAKIFKKALCEQFFFKKKTSIFFSLSILVIVIFIFCNNKIDLFLQNQVLNKYQDL